MHHTASTEKKKKLNAEGKTPGLTEHYHDQFQFVPGIRELIGTEGKFIPGSTKNASDYSYFAQHYSGDHFRIIGDAASESRCFSVLISVPLRRTRRPDDAI